MVGPRSEDDVVYEYKMRTPEGNKYSEYSNSQWARSNYESVANMPAEAVTDAEYKAFLEGMPFSRSKTGNSEGAQNLKEIQDLGAEYMQDALIMQKAQALAKDGNLIRLKPSELRQLGFPDKESFMNWLIRTVKYNAPSTLTTYLTNAAGRPQFGRQAGPVEIFNHVFNTELFKNKSKEDKEKSRIGGILGL